MRSLEQERAANALARVNDLRRAVGRFQEAVPQLRRSPRTGDRDERAGTGARHRTRRRRG